MNKIILLILSTVFSISCFAQTKKPNVLFIAVDDMNDWVGCLKGHSPAKTPHIDSLAKRGMLFTNAHCPSPLCGPSRAAVMSGLRPSTSGIYNNHQWLRPNLPEVKTIPEHFKANNYHVAGAGKIFHHTAGSNPPDQWHQFRRMTYDDPWDRYYIKMAKTFGNYYKKIKSKGKYKEAVRAYLANIAFADAQVGRLLQTFDKSGHADNTIIVFWSDIATTEKGQSIAKELSKCILKTNAKNLPGKGAFKFDYKTYNWKKK